MRKIWVAVAIVLIVAGGIWYSRQNQPTPADSSEQTNSGIEVVGIAEPGRSNAMSSGGTAAFTATDSANDIAARASSPIPSATNNESEPLPPLTVLDNARVAIHDYNAQFGENPVGNNAEITAALMGKNPKQINFIRPDAGLRVNDKGELIDSYGTPFFFHALSGKEMEIRSAGQDKIMWTFDDLVTR
jgi:hypothetical protein